MYRLLAPLALMVFCTGCTVDRIHHDAEAGLDYLRLSNGSQISASSRWQFSPDTRIAVSEVAPAAREDWLASAQEGIGSVFGFQVPPTPEGGASAAEIDLLIAWPGERLASATDTGYIKYLRIDKMIRGSDPLSVRVFLCDAQTQTLIQAATLDLSARWFSGEGARGEHIREAFQDYAQGLVSRF